jgi:hypothetical protein
MRGATTIAVILALAPLARAESALDAVKQLPRDQAARIAKIEARDGAPDPDRWYILTQDPASDNGVHEFVVSNGEIVASRSISQFAQSLKPEEMLGAAPLNIDSDKAAEMARAYAEANGAVVASMNYELKKDGPGAAPAWTISCVDDQGNKVGEVVVTAGKGNVVSHDGFILAPDAAAMPGSTPKKKEEEVRFDTYAKPDVATAAAAAGAQEPDDEDAPGAGKTVHHHHRRIAQQQENVFQRTFQNVGRTLQKYFPF